jgi:hypothetical protein
MNTSYSRSTLCPCQKDRSNLFNGDNTPRSSYSTIAEANAKDYLFSAILPIPPRNGKRVGKKNVLLVLNGIGS